MEPDGVGLCGDGVGGISGECGEGKGDSGIGRCREVAKREGISRRDSDCRWPGWHQWREGAWNYRFGSRYTVSATGGVFGFEADWFRWRPLSSRYWGKS